MSFWFPLNQAEISNFEKTHARMILSCEWTKSDIHATQQLGVVLWQIVLIGCPSQLGAGVCPSTPSISRPMLVRNGFAVGGLFILEVFQAA